MAELNLSNNRKQSRRSASQKQSTKVDLTPMVDLGFLLITFFIFTTTLGELKSMSLFIPAGEDRTTLVPASKSLSLILDANEEIHYFKGELSDGSNLTTIHQSQLSTLLQSAKSSTNEEWIVLIHSTPYANFKDVVDVLDEMTIHQIKRYSLSDLDSSIEKIISQKQSISMEN